MSHLTVPVCGHIRENCNGGLNFEPNLLFKAIVIPINAIFALNVIIEFHVEIIGFHVVIRFSF